MSPALVPSCVPCVSLDTQTDIYNTKSGMTGKACRPIESYWMYSGETHSQEKLLLAPHKIIVDIGWSNLWVFKKTCTLPFPELLVSGSLSTATLASNLHMGRGVIYRKEGTETQSKKMLWVGRRSMRLTFLDKNDFKVGTWMLCHQLPYFLVTLNAPFVESLSLSKTHRVNTMYS